VICWVRVRIRHQYGQTLKMGIARRINVFTSWIDYLMVSVIYHPYQRREDCSPISLGHLQCRLIPTHSQGQLP